jgi:hypothetical protein
MAAAPGPGDKQLVWALRDFASCAILISVMSHCESAALVNFSAFLVFYFSWLCWAEQHLFCLSLPSPTIAPKVLTPKSAHTIRFKLPTFYCGFWMDTWQEVCILVVYVCVFHCIQMINPKTWNWSVKSWCTTWIKGLDRPLILQSTVVPFVFSYLFRILGDEGLNQVAFRGLPTPTLCNRKSLPIFLAA